MRGGFCAVHHQTGHTNGLGLALQLHRLASDHKAPYYHISLMLNHNESHKGLSMQ